MAPEERSWVRQGILPKTARSLVKAGIRNVADLAGWSREQLLNLSWVSKRTLARLEQLWGSPLPSRKGFWEEQGIAPLLSNVLVRAGIDSLDKLGALNREQFLAIHGLGTTALRECERVLGRPLESPYPDWCRLGLPPRAAYRLSLAGVRTPGELMSQSRPALRAMGLHWSEIESCLAIAGRHSPEEESHR
jgi:hypothetical protein